MHHQHETILRHFFRKMLISFAGVIGFFAALFFLIVSLSLFFNQNDKETPEPKNKIVMLPDANGNLKKLMHSTSLILQLEIDGIIGLEELDRESIRQKLFESRRGDLKNRIKGILLYINTPGGTVLDSDEIYRSLKEYKEEFKIPVYAYVEGLCASGGMYIACAADKVYSSDVSIIGSVGVLLPTVMNFYDLLKSLGIDTKTITSGKFKDALNPFRPWKEGEDEMYRNIVEHYYKQFVDIVTENRSQITRQELIENFGAKVFPAEQAKRYGYIDVNGASRDSTLKELVIAAGIKDKEEYQVIRLEEKGGILEYFKGASAYFTGGITHTIRIENSVDPRLQQHPCLYLYHPGRTF
ncbi:MAG: S49 family peptidase [Chlamydiales bacterium]